jgi:hypothetical protein
MRHSQRVWLRIHQIASLLLGVFATIHSVLTLRFYDAWTAEAVWFLGTGLGLMFLALLNWALVREEPTHSTVNPLVRWSNVLFAIFGVCALSPVPGFQATTIVVALLTQAAVSQITLRQSSGRNDSALM